MTGIVRLLRSGHEFPVEPSETLLEAALRAGIYIDYGCSNGSCGDCKARLIEGQLGSRDPHDFPLSESARAEGWFLPCRTHAVGDLVIDAKEAGQAADIDRQLLSAKVAKLERRSENILILNLRTARSRTLRFLAGQRIRLTLPGGSSHSLPIASCPCNGLILQFHLFRDPDSAFSIAAFETLRTGDIVELDGPFGEFTLDDDSPLAQLFLTYEAAFATTKSLIEHAISLDADRPRRLVWLARSDDCHYLANLGRSWADSLDDFGFTAHIMSTDDWASGVAAAISQLQALSECDIYVSGPRGLLAASIQQLAPHGVLHLDQPD
ncbi:MAG: 2Fe-2S iron-sulfur cluster binding domain-containing protein [Gammaproteobacteria bacterium]|nr:2Fe-2S iron-sulfur cluster binding domain-containing protein [Gammaproteobacteria bacterium]MCP5137412.1 2Fe-2S iron-sulfur cluster binding domain-containing protein [Gammaproteobacteria bacterium]